MTKIFLKKRDFQTLVNKENKDKLSLELKDLELSVRAMNSLSNQGIKTLSELIAYTEYDLRSFPNMGRTTIDEIKKLLENFSLYLGMDLDHLNSQENQNVEVQLNKEWNEVSKVLVLELIKDFNEIPLSLRAKNALLNLGCNYVGDIISINKSKLFRSRALGYKSIVEIEEYLKNLDLGFGDQLDPWNKDIVIKLREQLREEVSEIKKFELTDQDKLLEVELKRVLSEAIQISKKDTSTKDRVIDILNSRFGLDGSPAKTLELIGQKYNVTRERIRQNESYGLRKLKFSKPITPILDKVFEILNQSLPITEIEFNRILKDKGLTNLKWDFKGLQDFYESYTVKQDFYVSKINNIKIISKASVENIFRLVLVNTNKIISNSGLFSLTECMGLKDIYLNNIKKETVKKIIQTKPMFNWLDEHQNYFTYYSKRNRLSNLISKVSKVSKSIEVDLLYQKIKNYPRIYNDVSYSSEILISFCKVSFDCKLEDAKVIKFENSESKVSDYDGYKGNFISPNEQKMVQIFKEYGPILEYDDLRDLAKSNEVKKDSLSMILQFSPLFHRIDIGFYTLTEKLKENTLEKIISIINLESLTFAKDECPTIKGKKTFIEVNKNGHLFKSLPYERPMRLLPDGSNGVVYNRKVYPIINSIKESEGKRKEVDID